MADKYILRVTAGPSYNLADHVEVPVNSHDLVSFSTDHMDIDLNVRIQNYSGLPRTAPATSPYFDHEPHAYNKDQYSIAFRFTPKNPDGNSTKAITTNGTATESTAHQDGSDSDNDDDTSSSSSTSGPTPAAGISALDLQFGNDFDHPIRDRLPPGFGTAMNMVKWWIDPGLEGDAYADEPYLYGPALSSFNAVHVGRGVHDEARGGLWFDEGGDEQGVAARQQLSAPADAKARMKWALRDDSRARWTWEYGRTYGVDFYNPYIDFAEFALRLPGFHLPIIKYWDGQGLRYVLRNRSTRQVYLVVLFTLYLKEDVNDDGSLKPSALAATEKASGGLEDGKGEPVPIGDGSAKVDGDNGVDEARRKLSEVDLKEERRSGGGDDEVD